MSDRGEIRAKVIEIFKKIQKKDGYHNDMADVFAKLVDWKTAGTLPVTSVMLGLEVGEWADESEDLTARHLMLVVTGCIEAAIEDMEQAIDDYVDDIETALLNNSLDLFTNTQAKNFLVYHVEPELITDAVNKAFVGIGVKILYYHE
jgi:hypothetical protein